MNIPMPKPIAEYVAAANAHDADAAARCFASDAVVADEGQERRGRTAIRTWKEEVTLKYHPRLDVTSVREDAGTVVVTGQVSGDFPGSPVELSYAFTLAGDKIVRLEIA